jgi:hypothetical protein
MMTSGGPTTSAYLESAVFIRIGSSPVGFKVASDGFVYTQTTGGGYVSQYRWLTGSGTGAAYDIYCEDYTGTPLIGTIDTWLNLASDRAWTMAATAGTLTTGYGKFKIRDASTSAILVSAIVIQLDCDRT